MRTLIGLFSCLAVTACIHSDVDGKRTARAGEDLQPMRSLLVFVESVSANSSKEVEAVVVKELHDSGVAVQAGSAHIAYDAPINELFDKAETLGVDGTLVIAVESTGVEVNRDPMPSFGPNGQVYRRDSTSSIVGQYSARLYDMRSKGKHPRVWQAKANARTGGGLDRLGFRKTNANDITAEAARQIVSELKSDDMIARAEQ
jgi:hypothetical protein